MTRSEQRAPRLAARYGQAFLDDPGTAGELRPPPAARSTGS
ncbi:hypothetical protein ACOKM5_14210 [Streptomyces sp. BH097]